MKVCPKCHSIIKDESLSTCPKCQEELLNISKNNTDIPSSKVSELSNFYHQDDVREHEKVQNGLCLVVLGSISLIIGVLFIILSLKKRTNKIIGINFASLQFIICVICLTIGIILLVYGLVKIILAQNKRSKYKIIIQELASLKSK